MKANDFITEASMFSKVNAIADALNKEISRTVLEKMTGKRRTMLALKDQKVNLALIHVKDPGMRVWTRGDGVRYKDPGYFYVNDSDLRRLGRKYSTIKTLFPTVESVIEHVWEVLKSKPRSKDLGTVSGEFGSDKYEPALRAGGLLWVKRNNRYIDYGSMSRISDTSVWHNKPPVPAEDDVDKGDPTNEDIQNAFHKDTTEMPFYDNMMQNPEYFERAKGLVSELVNMSPSEYLNRVADGFGKTVEQVTKQRDAELVEKYTQKMIDGEQFPILTLDYSRGPRVSQEGVHRSMAAIKAGVNEVPVLIVTSTDE